jgi:hypothetical protein
MNVPWFSAAFAATEAGPGLAEESAMTLFTPSRSRPLGLLLFFLATAACHQNGSGLAASDDGGEDPGASRGQGGLAPVPPARGGSPLRDGGASPAGGGSNMSMPPAGGGAIAPGPCGQAGATCTSAAGCCSNRCEPVTGVPTRVCGAACFGEGAACTQAQDCCSLGCFGGKCVTHTCTVEGESCKGNAECCSNLCNGGRCQIDRVNRDCRPTGEDCTSGTGRGCCSNVCDERTKRCGLPAATCHASGATCAKDGDCCRGTCDLQNHTCRTACAADQAACTSAADCCNGACTAGRCGPPLPPAGNPADPGSGVPVSPPDAAPACAPLNGACAADGDCCSSFCFGGRCDRLIL